MSIRGIELLTDTAGAQKAIRDAGYGFVVGHLGTEAAGHLTATRANDYLAAGLSIVSLYDAPQQPAQGTPIGYDPGLFEDPAAVLRNVVYRAGVADSRSAYLLAKAAGQSAGSAVYFEVGADVNSGISYVLDYFRGIKDGFSDASMGQAGYKVGVLGSGYVLDSVYGAGLANYKWLAAPVRWQGSAGYTSYDILEYNTGDGGVVPGALVNHDMTSDAKAGGDFGQWAVSTLAANLVINELTVRPQPLLAGGTATIVFAIGNVGAAAALASKATLFLSTDATITVADTVLGTFDIPSLAANAATRDSLTWAIPSDTVAGTYYIGIAADAVPGEVSSTDNGYAVSFTVVGSPEASTNLVINDLSLGAAMVAAGARQAINLEIGNAGLGTSGATKATLYLSLDANITAADVFLGAFQIPALAPNTASARSLSATIPGGTAEGTYYIGVLADQVAGETNPNDNAYAVRFEVTGTAAPAPNLVINDLVLGASPVPAGGVQMIDVAVGNAGSATSAASVATVYLSTDTTITPADAVLGRVDVPSLAAGGASTGRLWATIPAGTAAGTYYVGVMAAPVSGEASVNDNAYAVSFAVNIAAGSVSIADVTLSEGNSGTTLASFVVTRTGGTAAFDVDFATADGGATIADADYTAASGTLSFGENVVVQTITVAINGDLIDETRTPQTFFVNLSGATNGAVIADKQGQASIADDDRRNRPPELTARDVRVHIGQRVAGASMVTTVTDADGDAITEYSFRDTGIGGGFLQVAGIAQPSGAWTTVAASALGTLSYTGGASEDSEGLEVRVFDGQGWSDVGQLTATTIADIADDYGSTPESSGAISFGGSITGRIETPGDTDWLAVGLIAGRTYRFDLQGSASGEGTLTDPVLELRDSSGSSLAIAKGESAGGDSSLIYKATTNDTVFISAGGAGALTGSYRLAAAHVPTSLLAITALDARKPEGRSGTTSFTFSVTRSGDLSETRAASYAVTGAGQRPASATDFLGDVFPSGSLAFLPGETTKTIDVTVAGDVTVEDTEAFTVTLVSSAVDVVVETATSEGLIRDDDTITDLVIVNAATNQAIAFDPRFYDGPVAGLEKEIIAITPDNLNAAVSGDNWFIRTGNGTDALAAHGGRNVLDGGGGSNFLTGASGEDTFFLDARGAAADIWSTVLGFDLGDTVTVWGISPSDTAITWANDLGASGFSGLTMQATAQGRPNALLTLVGFSKADMESGKIQAAYGSADPSSPYLHIYRTV